MSDLDIAKLSRELCVDIAVDLGGYTGSCRTGIFAYRAAPIQLSYIGYLGTMGADYIDYIIADKTIIPESLHKSYSEKIAYLPSYQVNDRKRIISEKQFTRAELDLPEAGFVFCCFNNNYKILPETFDGWIRILKAVEGSVLFLYAENEWSKANLIKEAKLRDIDGARLVFGRHIPPEEYLARYRACDLFLDTFPYNAGTTASDALWAGLPTLTMMGKSFASRMAASLLNAIGLPELITNTQEEYEALAIELAMNPNKLTDIKNKLASNRLTTPLFDTPLFTKNLEVAYSKMYERYQDDLQPDHITII
jgi:predicted O-linked N-acetylglucosamine transferase (SPINDLY family)